MAVNLEKEMTLEEKLMKAGLYQAVAILRMHERNEAKKRKASTLKMIKRQSQNAVKRNLDGIINYLRHGELQTPPPFPNRKLYTIQVIDYVIKKRI